MSALTPARAKPVWAWLPGADSPVRCGTFSWRPGLGEFSYDPQFRQYANAVAIDPLALPLTRAVRPHRELRQDGLFGVLRDASPEGWGLDLLEHRQGRALDVLDRLELSLGDAVGALEVCEDLDRKLAYRAPSLSQLLAALGSLELGAPSSRAARQVQGEDDGTSLGGERPKLTVLHEGQLWIAKLQAKSDPPNSPLREHLAMTAARAAGLHVAQTQFWRVASHQLVAVRRFDRHVQPGGQIQRSLVASAHTMLRLNTVTVRGDRERSYPYLASALQRWGVGDVPALREDKRELWRRMVFNAVVGNGDDHPRNHAVVHSEGHWRLSPAFDLAPYITFGGALAMSITREGHASAARWALMRDCATFEYDPDEAAEFIDKCIEITRQSWEAERARLGFAAHDAPTPNSAAWLDAPAPADLPRRTARHRRVARPAADR